MSDPATPPSPAPAVEAWAVTVPESAEDEVSGLIWTLGCHGITIDPPSRHKVRLVCFFTEPESAADGMEEVAGRFGGAAQRIRVPNPDWVARFKETFVAFDAPPFRIVPAWHDHAQPENPAPPPGATGNQLPALRVDPGQAFGTGTHESTRLCLRTLGAIAPHLRPRPRTLDLGCGTGILGIAAVTLIGAQVVACDHDPLAAASAVRHAGLNQTSLEVVLMDGCRGFRSGRFDLILANLMAPFLISRADEIAAMGAPGARFVLAGLLRDEEQSVKDAWPRNWKVASSHEGEWASLLYERP